MRSVSDIDDGEESHRQALCEIGSPRAHPAKARRPSTAATPTPRPAAGMIAIRHAAGGHRPRPKQHYDQRCLQKPTRAAVSPARYGPGPCGTSRNAQCHGTHSCQGVDAEGGSAVLVGDEQVRQRVPDADNAGRPPRPMVGAAPRSPISRAVGEQDRVVRGYTASNATASIVRPAHAAQDEAREPLEAGGTAFRAGAGPGRASVIAVGADPSRQQRGEPIGARRRCRAWRDRKDNCSAACSR